MQVAKATGSSRPRKAAGFTLIELMIVVVIVGILSAIAIPTFQSYLNKSRTAEATETLGSIKMREESYRSEFGRYMATVDTSGSGGIADLADHTQLSPNPEAAVTQKGAVNASDFTASTVKARFDDLGVRVGSARFGYGVAAGDPSDLPGLGWTADNADFWFVAQAQADLDFDGDFVTFEAYSASRYIWIGVGTDEEDKGWD